MAIELTTPITLTEAKTQPAEPLHELPCELPVEVEWTNARRTASAKIRDGVIVVSMSKQWPKHDKDRVVEELSAKVQKQFNRDCQLVNRFDPEKLLTIHSPGELRGFVDVLNRTTLNSPLRHVRIGHSRYSRLAQMNIKTRTLTVSHYCLKQVPSDALRYLMLHELAHLTYGDHSAAFWNLVAQYVPDYKRQDKVMQAFHRVRLFEDSRLHPASKAEHPHGKPPRVSKTKLSNAGQLEKPKDIIAEPKHSFWGAFQLKLPF